MNERNTDEKPEFHPRMTLSTAQYYCALLGSNAIEIGASFFSAGLHIFVETGGGVYHKRPRWALPFRARAQRARPGYCAQKTQHRGAPSGTHIWARELLSPEPRPQILSASVSGYVCDLRKIHSPTFAAAFSVTKMQNDVRKNGIFFTAVHASAFPRCANIDSLP